MITGKDKEELNNLKTNLSQKDEKILRLEKENEYLKRISDEGLEKYSNIEYAKILASSTQIIIAPNVRLINLDEKQILLFEVCIKGDKSLERLTLYKDVIDLVNVYENTKRLAMYGLLKDTCKFAKNMFDIHKKRNISKCEISIARRNIDKELSGYFQV